MVSGSKRGDRRGTTQQGDDGAGRAAPVLRRASAPVRLGVPAAQPLGRPGGDPRRHLGGVVCHDFSLPALGLGRHGFSHGALVLGARSCVSLGEAPPKDAQGSHEPEGVAGGLSLAGGGRGVCGVGLAGLLTLLGSGACAEPDAGSRFNGVRDFPSGASAADLSHARSQSATWYVLDRSHDRCEDVFVDRDDIQLYCRAYWDGQTLVFDTGFIRGGEEATNVVRYTLESGANTFRAAQTLSERISELRQPVGTL